MARSRLRRTSVLAALTAAGTGAGLVLAASPASADIFSNIRQCESGGNYSTNTGNGYYGAYQFTQGTWNSLGYSGLPSDASPATLKRAVAFIEENAQQDITIADIAAAASVTMRAVQLAFRRHLGTTPTRYLRQVRLDRAHRDLLAADPGHETVTAVAYRWGFPSPGRFASYYQQVYGVRPSRALRRH